LRPYRQWSLIKSNYVQRPMSWVQSLLMTVEVEIGNDIYWF
jgi:hypothetical protein